MDFVLDGYNLLHAIGLLAGRVGPRGLEQARNRLLGLVAAAHADEAVEVTVVFDARRAPPGVKHVEYHGPIRVVFAVGEEADDRIEEIIAHESAPRRLVVVSDDRRLKQAAQRRRCQSWTCDRYLDWIERRRDRPRTLHPEKPITDASTDWNSVFGHLDRDAAMQELFGPDFGEDGDGI
ncbi:MAG: NYN domain-containing protein [Gemmataceae bacterium]